MSKTGRKVAAALMALVGVCTLFGAVACGKDNGKTEQQYTVTYVAGADDAYGETQTASYKKGDKFNLLAADTFERDGYTFTEWSDGTASYKAGAEYTMPEKNVTFTANWEEVNEPLPEGTETITSFADTALTITERNAKSHWTISYGENALNIVVNVEDKEVFSKGNIYQNDGIEVRVSKVQRVKGYSDGTIAVLADVAGRVSVKNLKTTETVTDSGVTAEAKYLTIDGVHVAGYRITLAIPYSVTEITAANKDAALAVSLTNASNAANAGTATYKEFKTDVENVHTYFAVTDDNAYAENPDVIFAKNWGDAGSMKASRSWNVDSDDGSEAAHIFMEGNDYQDNYIYMYRSDETNMYAEMKIAVKGVMKMSNDKYDEWPKFGLTMTTTDGQTGFFYYVDAASNAATGAINSNAVNLGINKRTGGGWENSGWSSIGKTVGTDASVYQGDNYITLGIYRQGGAFSLCLNGEPVYTFTCGIKDNDIAYVGLASFNIKLDVKDYSIKTDDDTLDHFRIQKKVVDYLFIGDSYVDTAFWYNYEKQFGSLSAANMGIGGTQIGDWLSRVGSVNALYNPSNIVIHIGVNDIDDGNTTGETAIARLETMLDAYHEAFPEAKIYYITVEHNMMFTEKWAEYDVLNDWARDEVKNRQYLEVIDMAALITADADGSTMYWFNADGLHLGVDGYALWNREICKALGISHTTTANGLGDVTVADAPAFSYSAGITYSDTDKVWHIIGKAETKLPISEAYGADVYATADVSVKDPTLNGEGAGKAGLLIASSKHAYFFFINLSTGANPDGKWDDNYGAIVYRPEGTINRNWDWGKESEFFAGNGYTHLGSQAYDYNVDSNAYKTMGILKQGNMLYFYASGAQVGKPVASKFAANEKVAVSVFNFNTEMFAKNGYATTDATEVNNILHASEPIKTMDGDMKDWTEKEKSNPFVIPATEGRSITFYAAMDDRGVNVFVDAYHKAYVNNAGDWHLNTNAEFRFGTDSSTQWWINAKGDKNKFQHGVMKTTAPEVQGGLYHTVAELFVPYAAIEGNYTKDSAFVPMGASWKTDGEGDCMWRGGDWWNEAFCTPADLSLKVTKDGLIARDAEPQSTTITLDGETTDWEDVTFTKGADRCDWAAKLESDGLYLCIKLHQTTIASDRSFTGGDAWLNQNVEIQGTESMSGGIVFMYNGECRWTEMISKAAMKYTDGDTEDTLVFEVFIANENMRNVTSATTSVKVKLGGQLFADNTDRESRWIVYATDAVVSKVQ